MSKPASCGIELFVPPRPTMMLRSARSFMSTTRFQTMRRGSIGQGVAVVDVVVEHGRQEVVGQLDGVEIAGEMEVDVLHGHDLGVAAAGRPALHAEARAQRGLAQADASPACRCGSARRTGRWWWWSCLRRRAWA